MVAHSPLTPVFTGLRWGLHALFVGLVALVVARAVFDPSASPGGTIALAALLLAVYLGGGAVARPGRRRAALVWFAVLVAIWVCLAARQAEAAYLVFPFFFLALHLVRGLAGPAVVVALTVVTVVVIGTHSGWSVGGVAGPVVGAGVALLIGYGYAALAAESAERERLLAELVATRDALVASEREQAVLAERARLARDIHDTVAQGLSSIGMLLHAAERADPERPGVEHLRLARETAAASLLETRGLIRELAPPDLRGERGLAGALERLAATQWRPAGLDVEVDAEDLDLPMRLATPLLRIAQGAMANVVQHADARRAYIALTRRDGKVVLVVTDDGRGFDPAVAPSPSVTGRDSFGLRAIRERVEALGGTLAVTSAPGAGASVRVEIDEGSEA